MDDRLLAAYRATTYRCMTPRGRMDIRIGRTHPRLDALLGNQAVRTWGFITAVNPQSRLLADAENRRRQTLLREALVRRGLAFYEGEGVGDDGTHPAEPSYLVLGIARDQAIALARQFDQAAIVFGEINAPAELIDCNSAG